MTVKGTNGYAGAIHRFIEATDAIGFKELHEFCAKYIPISPGKILDIGSGSGRDAAEFAAMGHSVVAAEPCPELLVSSRNTYPYSRVEWVEDSLPELNKLTHKYNQFDFILCSAVWHHIDDAERETALAVIARLLKPRGIFAVSLRNGPVGVGIHVFPTDANKTIDLAESCNLINLLHQSNQPSLIRNKKRVIWSKLVFRRG